MAKKAKEMGLLTMEEVESVRVETAMEVGGEFTGVM